MEFETQGLWWDVSHPEIQVPGTLSITENGHVELELFHPFNQSAPFTAQPPIEVLCGVGKQNRYTLIGNRQTRSAFASEGLMPVTYTANAAILKKQIEEPHHLKFDRIACRMQFLTEWVHQTGFKESQSFDAENNFIQMTHSYCHPPVIEARLGVIAARFESGLDVSGRIASRGRQMTEYHQVRFDSAVPLTLEEWSEQALQPLKQFMGFAVGRSVEFTKLSVMIDEHELTGGGKRVGYQFVIGGEGAAEESRKYLHPSEMTFSREDLGDDLASALGTFGTQVRENSSFASLLTAVSADNQALSDASFFSTVRSLESWHRQNTFTTSEPIEGLQEIIEMMIEQIPSDFDASIRESLVRKVSSPLETSLRNRLKEILTDWPEIVAELVGGSAKIGSFIHKTIVTRNCFAHGSDEPCSQAASGFDLVYLGIVWSVIGEAVLLAQMGIENERIQAIFKSKQWIESFQDFRRRTSFD